jgi:hypothetical protein
MNILQYKVVSYLVSTDGQPYVHGYYDTQDVAERVANNYNVMFNNGGGKLYAKVEKA